MTKHLFAGQETIPAHAFFLGERIDVRNLDVAERLAKSPPLIRAGNRGAAALFRYGAVVLFGLDSTEEAEFLDGIRALVQDPFAEPMAEEALLRISAGQPEEVEDDTILLESFCPERLQLIAEVLAKSVVLDHYEQSVGRNFVRIEPLALDLERSGRPGPRGKELLRHIGEILAIQGKMVGRVEITEKPDLLWNHPELERVYLRLEDEFELAERHLALERKLELISRTAETLLGLLQNRRSLRVEWYITILIVVEIGLTLYEMFLPHP